jgi:hypothetical protein
MHFVLWLAFAAASPGSLQDEPGLGGQFETARSVGMGGAQRAIADQIDAIYLNPAGMSVKPHYLIGGTFQWNQAAQEYAPSVAIVDSATTVVAAGLSYGFDRRSAADSGVMDIHRFHLATSYSFGGVVSIGLTLKYLTYKREFPSLLPQAQRAVVNNSTADGSAAAVVDLAKHVQGADVLTGDLGMLVTPIPQLSLAVVGYNLIPKCDQSINDSKGKSVGFPNNVPGGCIEREIAPLAMSVAAAAHIMGLELGADIVFDFWTRAQMEPRFHFGAEYSILDMVPLRAGVIVDRVSDEIYWTAGAGIFLQQVGFDVGYREGTVQTSNRTLIGSIRVQLN